MIRFPLLPTSLGALTALLLVVAPASAVDFGDRALLVDSLGRYGPTVLTKAQEDLAAAEMALADAIAAGDTVEQARLENEVLPVKQAALTRAENFDAEVAQIVDQLSDEQVMALNRSLQNTLGNGIVPTLDLAALERIAQEGFDDHQIQAFVMAYREEAKFLAKADRFDPDSRQYQMAMDQAASQKERFLAKVDRFGADGADGALGNAAAALAAKEARATARATSLEEAQGAARGLARAEARHAAKALGGDDGASGPRGLAKGRKK